jgi:hypothetical protein
MDLRSERDLISTTSYWKVVGGRKSYIPDPNLLRYIQLLLIFDGARLTCRFLDVSQESRIRLKAFTCLLIDAGQRCSRCLSSLFAIIRRGTESFMGRTVNQAVHGLDEVLMQGQNGVHPCTHGMLQPRDPQDQHQPS